MDWNKILKENPDLENKFRRLITQGSQEEKEERSVQDVFSQTSKRIPISFIKENNRLGRARIAVFRNSFTVKEKSNLVRSHAFDLMKNKGVS